MGRGWKIILGLTLILAILIIIIFFFHPSRQILVHSLPLCNTSIEKAVESLVLKDFPEPWIKFSSSKVAEVMTVNDIRCETEYMANAAIILQDGTKIFFGIFHLHFSQEGNFISSASVTPWKKYLDRNDPKIDATWKDFIKTVYPEEMKKPD